MISKIISGLVLASLGTLCWGEYDSDYDYGGYRVEPDHIDVYEPPATVGRPRHPSADTSSYHLYHRDHRPVHESNEYNEPSQYLDTSSYQNEADSSAPQDHKPKQHNHDHGTSSMSFYQKVKHHDYKFKLQQKHGKHGSFHGYAHPYAYGGLKVHDF